VDGRSNEKRWYGSPSHTAVLVALSVAFFVAVVLDESGWQWLFAAALLTAVLVPPLRALLSAFTGRD
jgi:hypothetical protein